MAYYPKLRGEKCFLSPIQTEDAELWTTWLNDLEVTLPLGDEAYMPFSLEKMRADISGSIQRQDHIFTIVARKPEVPVGRCLLFNIDHINGSAMLGIFIGEKSCWGQGIGTEAVRLLLDYGFNLLNLHSVMLGAFEFNQRAIRAYEKVGFRMIGIRRDARLIAGKHWNAVFMDILEDEYREKWKKCCRCRSLRSLFKQRSTCMVHKASPGWTACLNF